MSSLAEIYAEAREEREARQRDLQSWVMVLYRSIGRTLSKEVTDKITSSHENAVIECLRATTVPEAQDWLDKAKHIRKFGV